ncbi:endolytic transglycosylase MltG [Streptomyces sp. TR02-1]|uniref:endolytic transglycosylase MltG n=1 Tax=Streptomyces sp. TR02-1 TaxID=3385977 RepID=UPI00399FCE5C
MTDYGRGSGSQPWHAEDPLFGDQGWGGDRQGGPNGDWSQAVPDPYAQPYRDAYQGYGMSDPHQTGAYPTAPYTDPSYLQQPHQGYPAPGYGDTGYIPPVHDDTGYQQPVPSQDPYGYGAPYPSQAHAGHGWTAHPGGDAYDPGPSGGPYDTGATDPYGMEAVPAAPEPEPEPAGPGSGLPRSGPDPETGWDPGPDQGESAFFRDDDAEDEGDGDDAAGGRGGRNRGGTKRRSSAACLGVLVLLGAVVGAAAWFGYGFYESHFAPAPDYSGEGRGSVQVEIEDGSSVTDMAVALEKAGVIKSTGAFTEASAGEADKAQSIQPGVYTLHREMSAAAAIDLMLDPASQSTLIVPEGLRASKVFALIDDRTGAPEGTTAEAADSTDLGLPKWADGRIEGFLYPSRYSVTEETEPADVLRKMVDRAESHYEKADLADEAERLGMDSPRDVLTVASLVQAEGKYKHDFVKVARVVYNRLKPGNTETNGYLQFDSTYNYAKNQSTLDVPSPSAMARFDDPYNTYARKGLPPGPINSPGAEALHAALQPADGDWYYFVSVTENNTVFSDTYEEHRRNVQKYEEAKQ